MARRVRRPAVVLLALVAASVLVWQGHAAATSQAGVRFEVASVAAEFPPAGSDGAGMTGRLGASRSGDQACFWISDSNPGGEKRYLFLARKYSADRALALLDEQSRIIARPGEIVTASIAAPRPGAAPEFCPDGAGMTVFEVSRPPT